MWATQHENQSQSQTPREPLQAQTRTQSQQLLSTPAWCTHEMWVQTRNENLVNTSVYFLLKKQATKLYQRPMCFDASASNSYESILQEQKVLKSLVFASTQTSRMICIPNNALCILPEVVEAKQVENVIFWKNKQIYFWNNKDLCNNKIPSIKNMQHSASEIH